jgi:mono/diheme cytochrome c family protein
MTDAPPPSRRPPWWIWLIAVAAGIVLIALALPSAPPPAPEPELSEADLRKLVHDRAVVEQGRALWGNCTVCHGGAGEGAQGPNLRDDYWLHGNDMSAIVHQIAEGAPFARPVAMPAWKYALKPAQIRALAAYVASLHGSEDGKGKAPEGKEQPITY